MRLGFVTTISTYTNSIKGLAATSDGDVYAAEHATISKYNISGFIQMSAAYGIYWQLKVALFAGTRVLLAGGVAGYADGGGTNAKFWNCYGLALVSNAYIFVADSSNSIIRKVTTDGLVFGAQCRNVVLSLRYCLLAGQVSTYAGSAGVLGYIDGSVTSALFNTPIALTADSDGVLYVSVYGGNSIRVISTIGLVFTIAGSVIGQTGLSNGFGTNSLFYGPRGLAVTTSGNVLVADYSNSVIRIVYTAGNPIRCISMDVFTYHG
jgi:hypothetical protein